MRLTKRWLWYIAPFWAVQFVVLLISDGPAPDKMWIWWMFVIFFNTLAFILAWDTERRVQSCFKEIDRKNKKWERKD